jgi:hypothetical protein
LYQRNKLQLPGKISAPKRSNWNDKAKSGLRGTTIWLADFFIVEYVVISVVFTLQSFNFNAYNSLL